MFGPRINDRINITAQKQKIQIVSDEIWSV